MSQDVNRRAVYIAAVAMQAAGLYSTGKCRRVHIPSDDDCVKCIERWLLRKAKKEVSASC